MAFANDCLDMIGAPPNKLQLISVGQNCDLDTKLQLVGPMDSVVIDLTQFGVGPDSSSSGSSDVDASAVLGTGGRNPNGTLKQGVEIIMKDRPEGYVHLSKFATILNETEAKQGIVHIEFDPIMTKTAGIWLGMALVWEKGVQRKQYPFYIEVTPDLSAHNPSGPLTIFEIRMSMRDIAPESNFLLDSVEFSNEEIAWAIRRPIEYWNEALPPVAFHTPQDFPYRYNWLNAASAELLIMCATWMRRNDLDYQAAGLQIMDTKKWPEYLKIGMERRKEWQEWVKNKKVSINVSCAFGTLTGYVNTPYR